MIPPVGLILAGGLSRRMGGGDKTLRALGGKSILARVVERLRPQVDPVLLNANGPAARFGLDLPVVPDTLAHTPGPLAGILAGLDHVARHFPDARYMLSVPADCPFLPVDLAPRLLAGLGTARAAFAQSGRRAHPVVGLWDVELREALRALLVDEDIRRVDRWTQRAAAVAVEWPALPYDPFFNVNTPDDLIEAERLLNSYPDI